MRETQKKEGKKSMESRTTTKGRNPRKTRLKRRRKTQFHRGGKKEEREKGMEGYVHGRRKGQVRRDMQKTVEQLGIVRKRVEERKNQNRKIRVVGTTAELGRRRERMRGKKAKDQGEEKGRIEVVTRGWLSGSLTNTGYLNKSKNKSTEKEGKTQALPGLIRFRHPNDHGVARKEARRCGVPTAGIVDSNCKAVERRTYPIPGNDESRAGQRRRRRRIQKAGREQS